MAETRLRGVVLAAGLGVRLRPLTHSLPKPLLPVAGMPLLARTLTELEAAGCEAVAINLHHKGEKISGHFSDHFGGMELVYSWEPELLGTLGALAPMADFLAPADLVVVVNGDSLCQWPITRLIKQHQKGEAGATLLVSSRADPADYGGGVGLDAHGDVVALRPGQVFGEVAERRVFAGAHVFAPDLVDRREREPADFVSDLYEPLLANGGKIGAHDSSRPWFDLGTPRRYLEGALDWARRNGSRIGRRSWISPEATIDEDATVRRSVVEAGVVIEAGVEVDRALVLPDTRVGAGARVRESVLGFAVKLPGGTGVERRMITAARADHPPDDRDSVVGGLVYSPL